ncbi:hypothetical protein KR51_00001070 [Rubidibacter lacunae KORDI 51-2]|uniref:Ergothioneine biosynthesis protein EgtB n=1 Tax=Rubidibacter lacunae KORDI 51-2 TaxID=582515 RepID=U5DU43_9CHRO|nr:SUMF1/EgtB/PvdO family nonheme iron enzyme [Rubidibacter lacunae]ERN43210.1 hypothetical protein KR51_00001070 [Rubidibacter lacunae KORDI 51-2]
MPYASTQSSKQAIVQAFEQCRTRTLDWFATLDRANLCRQAHPEFSPVGWHLGHIAFTEALWILERCAGESDPFPEHRQLFAADGLPKTARQELPNTEFLCEYLHVVRDRVWRYLDRAPLEQQARLWWWLLQHECQHNETIAIVLQLQRWNPAELQPPTARPIRSVLDTSEMAFVPAGPCTIGSDRLAQDNARPACPVELDAFWIDRYPVTCEQFREFMAVGGYRQRQWWCEDGWHWLQSNPVAQPLYWSDDRAFDRHPVYGVSWYEATAYARFVGKRLPTELEWEKAACWDPIAGRARDYPWGNAAPTARLGNYDGFVGQTSAVDAHPAGASTLGCTDLLGNVWEWTASGFDGYSGFAPYPYSGYSRSYFDRRHRVLRGGSWATRPWALHPCWRNWYQPHVRQVFAGFRCTRDL